MPTQMNYNALPLTAVKIQTYTAYVEPTNLKSNLVVLTLWALAIVAGAIFISHSLLSNNSPLELSNLMYAFLSLAGICTAGGLLGYIRPKNMWWAIIGVPFLVGYVIMFTQWPSHNEFGAMIIFSPFYLYPIYFLAMIPFTAAILFSRNTATKHGR